MRRLCVFCGSSPGHRAFHGDTARAMGTALARRGLGLVYGGGSIGLMGVLADAVLAVHPWAAKFLFRQGRDHFAEIEAWAETEYGGDLLKKGKLLKIVDAMRKDRQP
jgi:hypothetical protein